MLEFKPFWFDDAKRQAVAEAFSRVITARYTVWACAVCRPIHNRTCTVNIHCPIFLLISLLPFFSSPIKSLYRTGRGVTVAEGAEKNQLLSLCLLTAAAPIVAQIPSASHS